MIFKNDCTIEHFWTYFSNTYAEEDILNIEPNGRQGVVTRHVRDVGMVEVWLDECSEGADKGGYVVWAKLLEHFKENGEPIVLECETDGSAFLFAGRTSVLG